jgi:uncharacterized membrane protein
MIRPSRVTQWAALAAGSAIAFTAGFLLVRYPALPSLLTVHFRRNGFPDGWQFKTYARVLLPVFVQLALVLTLGAIAALLLSRPHGTHDSHEADVKAATAAAEGVVLMTTVWVVFQGYAAAALAMMWQRQRAGLGAWYGYLEIAGIALTIVIAVRTHLRLGRRPYVPEHWRFGQLYSNAADPALFVPTRDGSRWTLNFGRPVAAALIGVVLVVGVIGPTVILGLLLR